MIQMQRDAIYGPQGPKPFRPADNSLSNRHLTLAYLLCFFIFQPKYITNFILFNYPAHIPCKKNSKGHST